MKPELLFSIVKVFAISFQGIILCSVWFNSFKIRFGGRTFSIRDTDTARFTCEWHETTIVALYTYISNPSLVVSFQMFLRRSERRYNRKDEILSNHDILWLQTLTDCWPVTLQYILYILVFAKFRFVWICREVRQIANFITTAKTFAAENKKIKHMHMKRKCLSI